MLLLLLLLILLLLQGNDPYPAEGEAGCPSQKSATCPTTCDADAKSPNNDFRNQRYTFDGKVTRYYPESAIQEAIMNQGTFVHHVHT